MKREREDIRKEFLEMAGTESKLALLAYFFSEDGRWNRFWNREILFLH